MIIIADRYNNNIFTYNELYGLSSITHHLYSCRYIVTLVFTAHIILYGHIATPFILYITELRTTTIQPPILLLNFIQLFHKFYIIICKYLIVNKIESYTILN